MLKPLATAVLLAASACESNAAPAQASSTNEAPREIFYVPFEGSTDALISRGQAKPYHGRVDGYIDGVKGKAVTSLRKYNGIRWDGCGNIDLERGTLALFYSPQEEPGPAQGDSLFGVSTEIEGYWGGIINFINKKGQGRDATPEFGLHFYDINRYTPKLNFKPIVGRWKKGEWHHLAMVWDRNQGITIYEDGKRADSNWGKYRWDWNSIPRMLVLGYWHYSTTPFAVDEMHIYADCLTHDQIAQLARCETPTGPGIPRLPPKQTRTADLARRGWTAEDIPNIPVSAAGKPLRLSFSRIERCLDAKRTVAQPFEGFPVTCWPIQKYGPSTAGKKLEILFAPEAKFDRVRIFSHGPFAGELHTPGPDRKTLLKVDSSRSVWQGRFDSPRTGSMLMLERAAGVSGITDFQKDLGRNPQSVGQIDFYRAEEVRDLPATTRTYRAFAKLDRLPDTLTGRAALGETPVHFENPVLATSEKVPTWKNPSPAFGGFQMITETLTEPVAMDGVVLTLVAEGLIKPTPIRVTVKEPVFPVRDWLAADVVLTPKGSGRQTFTIHLTGRPVISFPKDELKLPRKRTVSDPGRELAVLVTAADPVVWIMGNGGCRIDVCLADLEKVKPIATADQIEFAREAYAEMNEGHIWSIITEPGWGRLYYPLRWLLHFAPNERATMQLALAVGYRDEPIPFKEPANTEGAPEWAFWQRQAFNECKRILKWIIVNRGVETGEFGGVWGDDTDMTEYWTHDALAGDDDGVIGDALRKFWSGLYKHGLKDGVSAAVRDNLHSYEEGMGCIAHQMLLDYGDPNAIERVMRASGHYDKWMAQNPDGSYRFLGNYLGWGGVWTEGAFGRDEERNSLMLIPASYLVWYNRHPTAGKYILGWPLSLRTYSGIVADATLRLRGDKQAARKWNEEQAEKLLADRRYHCRLNCFLDEVGVKEEWKPKLLAMADSSFGFLKGTLPGYPGGSPAMTECFWMAYKATGDINYLTTSYKQACRFINQQDWLYTVAQPSTDRIPLPDTTVVRARIGAFVTERGGHTSAWPRHGLSYVSGSDQIAALVTENDESNLAARLYCFNDKEHDLRVRLWRLLPGTYSLKLSNDKNDDGKPEEALYEWRIEVDRGAYQDLKLPPRQCSILEIRAVQNREPVFDLPDPAIGPGDVSRLEDARIRVTVHNVGVKSVEQLLVRLTNEAGEMIAEQTIASIPAPLDFHAKAVAVDIPNLKELTRQKLVITLDPDQKHPDLNRYNNRLEFKD